MHREIFVHMEFQGKPHFVGHLWVYVNKGRQSAAFEYSREWKSSDVRFSLEPALKIGEGKYYTEKTLFGSIGDSAPDRWGRVLMERREARRAESEKRNARRLYESDYLLMVNDTARQGALRFSVDLKGPFLETDADAPIPPLVQLGRLLAASDRILAHKERDDDIRTLVAPGSSLGGARPKASIVDNDGRLLIAKFPSEKDEWDAALWECLCLKIAGRIGISVPGFRLEKVAGKNILLLERFDRIGATRVPFLSAMSMLGASDGDKGSYLEIVEALREHGSKPREDMKNLWRRMVFNILISNVDDHLRNHAFLYEGTDGWRLSPVYDLEPTPEHKKPRILHTNIDLYNGTASLELAYEVAEEFGLSFKEAKSIAGAMGRVVNAWDKEAAGLGAGRHEIEYMRSAFDHDDLHLSLKGKGG